MSQQRTNSLANTIVPEIYTQASAMPTKGAAVPKAFEGTCKEIRISRWNGAGSAVSSLRISAGYLPAIGGSSASDCVGIYISAHISSDKGEGKDVEEERDAAESYGEEEEDAVFSRWSENGVHRSEEQGRKVRITSGKVARISKEERSL